MVIGGRLNAPGAPAGGGWRRGPGRPTPVNRVSRNAPTASHPLARPGPLQAGASAEGSRSPPPAEEPCALVLHLQEVLNDIRIKFKGWFRHVSRSFPAKIRRPGLPFDSPLNYVRYVITNSARGDGARAAALSHTFTCIVPVGARRSARRHIPLGNYFTDVTREIVVIFDVRAILREYSLVGGSNKRPVREAAKWRANTATLLIRTRSCNSSVKRPPPAAPRAAAPALANFENYRRSVSARRRSSLPGRGRRRL
ncbi:hypothetical protein EVAR_39500_1 [Eumeta japonica]|uniref:Uncharacterized protein n=1 Tax=Eumeta variegata TaxID=151549 RepID=A0A4C1W0W0_EUMVA|nr:hypothetical protein EVAR_39500_1 [Eumeta japonica]